MGRVAYSVWHDEYTPASESRSVHTRGDVRYVAMMLLDWLRVRGVSSCLLRLAIHRLVSTTWQVRRIMLQHLAATLVQRHYRVYLARKCMRKEIAVRKEILLNRAAIPIQGLSLSIRVSHTPWNHHSPSHLSQQCSAASCTVAWWTRCVDRRRWSCCTPLR